MASPFLLTAFWIFAYIFQLAAHCACSNICVLSASTMTAMAMAYLTRDILISASICSILFQISVLTKGT